MKFEIFAGLGGGFGGAQSYGIYEFDSLLEATEHAYHLAVEEYESYEGCHGIMSWDDCRQDLIESGFDYEDEDVDNRYNEEIDNWIEYYVVGQD